MMCDDACDDVPKKAVSDIIGPHPHSYQPTEPSSKVTCEKTVSCLRVFLPMFVPSLSRQNDHFSRKSGREKERSFSYLELAVVVHRGIAQVFRQPSADAAHADRPQPADHRTHHVDVVDAAVDNG